MCVLAVVWCFGPLKRKMSPCSSARHGVTVPVLLPLQGLLGGERLGSAAGFGPSSAGRCWRRLVPPTLMPAALLSLSPPHPDLLPHPALHSFPPGGERSAEDTLRPPPFSLQPAATCRFLFSGSREKIGETTTTAAVVSFAVSLPL